MNLMIAVLIVLVIFLTIWVWRPKRQNEKLEREIKISKQAARFYLSKIERERNKDCDCGK